MHRLADPVDPASTTTETGHRLIRAFRKLWVDWRFFLGACFVTGCVLAPHAQAWTIGVGMLLAGLIRWGYQNVAR